MKKLTLLSSLATAMVLALPLSPREAQARPTGGRAAVSGPSHSFAGRPAFGTRAGTARFSNGTARFNGARFNNNGARFNGVNNARFNGTRRWSGNGNWNGNWNHHHHHHHGRVFVGLYPYDFWYPWGWYGGYPYGYDYYDGGYYGENYRRSGNGDIAANIQQQLARNGYYRGPIDGVIGPRTRSAIRAYERANGLHVDGLIDQQLVATLGVG